jgi:hypothetical protein
LTLENFEAIRIDFSRGYAAICRPKRDVNEESMYDDIYKINIEQAKEIFRLNKSKEKYNQLTEQLKETTGCRLVMF